MTDLKQLALDTAPDLVVVIEPFVYGTREDLKAFTEEILLDRLEAQLLPDGPEKEALIEQLNDQLKVLVETHRLRVETAMWALLKRTIQAVVTAVVKGLKAAI